MDSGDTPPSFSSVIQSTDKEETQIGTTVDVQAFGGSGVNPIATDIYGQPMSNGNFVHGQQNSLNQFQDGSISRGLDHERTTASASLTKNKNSEGGANLAAETNMF
ncbi:hypothetical protein L2E82_11112 [Cichorium intybus]|uniref:Uncharacterized protein n=1 Tax=Cichorium intybus TaxID=13427 RepID=A0ACB9GDE4_CICIN|nr:hypothetical protein L2E82_11112 [Cichorium intybus]